jgi:thymidylate synthase (FAD)
VNHEDKNITIDLYGDGIGKVQLIESMGNDLTSVNAARVSFGVGKEELDAKDKKLIKYLVEHQHTSPFEHCAVTFKFVVPMFVRSQHHRHRTWSYNEISRRYTDVNLRFYEPEGFRTQHKSNRQASNPEELINPTMMRVMGWKPKTISKIVKEHHYASVKLYEQLTGLGVCREQARGVLPQNLYTEYYGTANLLNILKFIRLRTHEGAQWEIQKVAEACLTILEDLYPHTVEAYKGMLQSSQQ